MGPFKTRIYSYVHQNIELFRAKTGYLMLQIQQLYHKWKEIMLAKTKLRIYFTYF